MSERIFGLSGSKDDKATEAEARLIEVRLTRSSEDGTILLTEFLRRINERGGIEEIKAALGKDKEDLDELAETLIRSGVSSPMGVEISRIRVKEVPIGPAPVEVRRSWVGTEMLAVRLLPGFGVEFNFVTNELMPARDAYAVLQQPAIDALRGRSPKAAEWFDKNLPEILPILAFGVDEVEIVASTSR